MLVKTGLMYDQSFAKKSLLIIADNFLGIAKNISLQIIADNFPGSAKIFL
jgi:hypothetical protein